MKTDAPVAHQYANATLQLASEHDAEKRILDDLVRVNEALEQSEDLRLLLGHPSIPAADKKQMIVSIFGGKVDDLTGRLLELMCDRRRLGLLKEVESEYRKLLRKKENKVVGLLTYAEQPGAREEADVKCKLAEQLKIKSEDIELDYKEDKSLIGGYVLRLGDQVIDGSLKGRLQAIEKSLLSV